MLVEISAGIDGLRCAYLALQIVPLNNLKEGKDSAVYSAEFSKSGQSAQSAEMGQENNQVRSAGKQVRGVEIVDRCGNKLPVGNAR